MLRLTWKRESDNFCFGFVLGDPESIRDLYWQLTHNYKANDGTKIGIIEIHSLDGQLVDIKELMSNPYSVVYPNARLNR